MSDDEAEPPSPKAIRRAVRDLTERSDSGEGDELLNEKREVVRNQIGVIKHQRDLAFGILRLNFALLSLVLVVLIAVLVVERDTVADAVRGVPTDAAIGFGAASLFFVAVVFLSVVFVSYLIVYSYKVMMNSVEVAQPEGHSWDLDTTRGVDDDEILLSILERQDEVIEANSETIEANTSRISGFARDSINLTISLTLTFAAVVFLGVLSQSAVVPELAMGWLAVVVGATGIPSFKFILDHYV